MLEMQTRVGEHFLDFRTDSEEAMGWLKHNFDLDGLRDSLPPRHVNLVVTIRAGYGRPFETFNVDISTGPDGVIYDRVDYKLHIDTEHRNAVVHVYDMYALKHALMNLYSAFIVHNGWGLLIHSSCVIEDGSAYVFSGRSGAGKSTIARLSQPRALLSDEATIVKVSDGEVRVYDSPFRSDTQPEFRIQGFPLAAIHLIHQSEHVYRDRTAMTQGIMELMDKVFYWAYDKEQTKTILKMYEVLARNVPIYDLYFQKNDTFWEAIS